MPFERDPLQSLDRARALRPRCKGAKSILDHRLHRQAKIYGRLAQSQIDRLSSVRFWPLGFLLSFSDSVFYRVGCT